ncbi:hypothetical protein AA313_de0200615 [Arthrobotrys entomopaga]|nr:hypothetical protein AA313_de0200615 [Arthrobotrys entomopaga]
MNLPTKTAKRDIVQGIKCLEEIAEYWLCGKRALIILKVLSLKYSIELPMEAEAVLSRIDTSGEMFGFSVKDLFGTSMSRKSESPPAQIRRVPGTRPLAPGAPPGPATTLVGNIGSPAGSVGTHRSPALKPGGVMASVEYGSPFINSGVSVTSSPPQMVPQTTIALAPTVPTSSLFTPYFDPGSSPAPSSYGRRSMEPTTSGTSPLPPPTTTAPSNANAFNGNSPSTYPGFTQLEDQSQDWWMRDQSELAQDFGGWDFSSGGTISPEPNQYSPPPSMPANLQTYVQQIQTSDAQQPPNFVVGDNFDPNMYWPS